MREKAVQTSAGITGIAALTAAIQKKSRVGFAYIALSDGKNTWVAKRQPMGRLKLANGNRHRAASKALRYGAPPPAGLPVDEA